MHYTPRSLRGRRAAVLAGLTSLLVLLAHSATWAQTTYKIQPIVKVGEPAGDVLLPPDYRIAIGGLNDRGQILFEAGSVVAAKPELLLQYADGKITPIVMAGRDAPTGKWPNDVLVAWPTPSRMNQRGNVVFTTLRIQGGVPFTGTYLWGYQARKVTPVLLKGMPAGQNLTFTAPGGFSPAINNRDELALVSFLSSGAGLFFRGQDGALLPILISGQELPDGRKVVQNNGRPAFVPSLNDAGAVAFLAQRQGEKQSSAYLWEQGTITPLVGVGAEAPGGGKITSVSQVLVNNRNRRVVLAAASDGSPHHGIYGWVEGQLTPVAVPGPEMPGGGKFRTLHGLDFSFFAGGARSYGISAANEAGEHVFLAELEEGSTAAYRMAADGKLSLILRSGMTTELGQITAVPNVGGLGVAGALNTQGQVALTVRIDGGPDTLVLLTPTGP
jgi:hypothetical protein